MAKFIRDLFLCSLLAFGIYLGWLFVAGSFFPRHFRHNLPYRLNSNGYTYARLKEVDVIGKVDVLVMGSSHAYRGYDPRIFTVNGFKMFNLGSSAQTPLQTAYLLDRYLDKLKPGIVVLDIYPELLQSDGVESSIDLLTNMPIDQGLVKLSFALENIQAVNVLFYSYLMQQMGRDEELRKKLKPNSSVKYIKGGYVEFEKGEYKAAHGDAEPIHMKFLPEQLRAFEHMIHLLKSRKIDYVLFQAPIPADRYKMIENSAETDRLMKKYGSYFNANNLLKIPDSCFYDNNHLNQEGVRRYNALVCSILDSLKQGKDNHLFSQSDALENK